MIKARSYDEKLKKIQEAGLTEEKNLLTKMQIACRDGLVTEDQFNNRAKIYNEKLEEIDCSGYCLCYVVNGKFVFEI